MNTASGSNIPLLKGVFARDYEIILEDLEFAFPKEQLETITKQWNEGAELEDIAKFQKRKPEEILLALIHQARKRKIERPFAYRRRKA